MISKASTTQKLSRAAFWFWTLSIFKSAFALMFFRTNPAIATGIGATVSLVFAYMVFLWILGATDLARTNAFPGVLKWIALYMGWAAISLIWTHSASPIAAIGYCGLMVIDVVIVWAMIRWGDLEGVAFASIKGIVLGGILISICAVLTKSDDPNGRLGDLEFLHPGNVGKFAGEAMLCAFLMWLKSRADQSGKNRWIWSGSSLFLIWIVLRSLSKTSIVALICAGSFYIAYSRLISFKKKLAVFAVAAVVLGGMYTIVGTYVDTYFEETPNDASTLTGRTVLWIESWEMIVERPIVGYGFISFRDYGPQDWEVRTTHAHNEWITQWFQLGLVGLLLAVAIYLSYFQHLRRSIATPQRELGFSMLIYMLIQGFAIAEPTGLMFPLGFMLTLATWVHPGVITERRSRARAGGPVLQPVIAPS